MNYDQLMELPWEQFLEEVFRTGPKFTTWYKMADWLAAHYTPDQIACMYVKLYKQLTSFMPEGQDEDPRADDIRDALDVFYYGTKQDLINKYLEDI